MIQFIIMQTKYTYPFSVKIFGFFILGFSEVVTYKFLVWALQGCVQDGKHITLGMLSPIQQMVGAYWLISFMLCLFFSFNTVEIDRKNWFFKAFCTPWSFFIGLVILCAGLQGFSGSTFNSVINNNCIL